MKPALLTIERVEEDAWKIVTVCNGKKETITTYDNLAAEICEAFLFDNEHFEMINHLIKFAEAALVARKQAKERMKNFRERRKK